RRARATTIWSEPRRGARRPPGGLRRPWSPRRAYQPSFINQPVLCTLRRMLDVARHAQIQFGLALLVLSLCLAALAIRNLFGRPPLPELWRNWARRVLDGALVLAAIVLALLAMTAAGHRGAGLDHSRVLHEAIQAKYHGELGWHRLYGCAWA